MLRRLYNDTMALASGRYAVPALAGVSFAESSFFPLPPDIILIPMVLAERAKAWWYALVATISSVVGGLAGYAIGVFLFNVVAEPLLEFYGYGEQFSEFQTWFADSGAWIVLFAGITPFPYKVITIASGTVGLSLPVFLIASIVARGLRFSIVAALLYFFGPPIRNFIERRLGLVFTIFMILLIGGFVLIRYVV
ncbi:MAG: YqaA family protein [Alphaproteobacteria bacterium]